MKVADTIFSIVCDDVREEVGGKLSIIGLYQEEIIFGKIPAMLPKLAFVIFLEGIKKTLPEVLVKASIPGRESQEIKIDKPNKLDKSKINRAIMSFFLSPVRFEEPGGLIIELYFGKEKNPTYTRSLTIREMSKNKKK